MPDANTVAKLGPKSTDNPAQHLKILRHSCLPTIPALGFDNITTIHPGNHRALADRLSELLTSALNILPPALLQ